MTELYIHDSVICELMCLFKVIAYYRDIITIVIVGMKNIVIVILPLSPSTTVCTKRKWSCIKLYCMLPNVCPMWHKSEVHRQLCIVLKPVSLYIIFFIFSRLLVKAVKLEFWRSF